MKHVFYSFFTVAALACGCSAPYIGDDAPIQSNIPTEFKFEIVEELTPSLNPLKVNISTLQEKDCSNANLKYTSSITASQVAIALIDMAKPEVCNGKGIVTRDVGIGVLENGTYNLQIRLKDSPIINYGSLSISNEYLQVTMTREAGIFAEHLKTARIPKNAVWGMISYEDASTRALANEMKYELQQEYGARLLTPGHYSYFDIGENQQITMRAARNGNQEFFAYKLDEVPNIKTFLKKYRNQGLTIKIYNGNGETW